MQNFCEAKSNVFFLKAQKTGSTGIRNTLIRFGVSKNKTFVLPRDCIGFEHPKPFSISSILNNREETYNMFVYHSRLNAKAVKTIMPEDTKFITILRNPIDQFISAWYYFDYNEDELFKNLTLENIQNIDFQFLDHLMYQNETFKDKANRMSFNLGFNSAVDRDNPIKIKQFIETIDHLFDLVLITDRMEESLILLKHLLCWKTEDVITLKVNKILFYISFNFNFIKKQVIGRKRKMEEKRTENISRDTILKLNRVDNEIYQYFLSKFEAKVEMFGLQKMQQEIQHLKHKTSQFEKFCEAYFPSVKHKHENNQPMTKDEIICWTASTHSKNMVGWLENDYQVFLHGPNAHLEAKDVRCEESIP